MIGLLKKDIYILCHTYYKNFLFVTLLYMVMALFSPKMIFVLFFLGWLSGFYIISSISIDNYSKWDLYATGMPLKKSQIVGAKFLLIVLFLGFFSLLACVLSTAASLFHSVPITENLLSTLVIQPIYLIFFGATLALSYKMGPEKARTCTTLFLAAAGGLILLLVKSDLMSRIAQQPSFQAFLSGNFPPVSFYLVEWSIALVLYLVCWYAATVIYKHKDF